MFDGHIVFVYTYIKLRLQNTTVKIPYLHLVANRAITVQGGLLPQVTGLSKVTVFHQTTYLNYVWILHGRCS